MDNITHKDLAILFISFAPTIWFAAYPPRGAFTRFILGLFAISSGTFAITTLTILLLGVFSMKIPFFWVIIIGATVGAIASAVAWKYASIPNTSATTTQAPSYVSKSTSPEMPREPQYTETKKKENRIPLIDIKFERVKAEKDFSHLEIQFAYDIYIHNKSSVSISNIRIQRLINPNKNKQKLALHGPSPKLRPFDKTVNVLAPGDREKIYREHLSSYEYTIFVVYYRDDSGNRYKCSFEGDRDGLRMIGQPSIIQQ